MLSYVKYINNCNSIINMCDILITDCINYEQRNSAVIYSNFEYYERTAFYYNSLFSFKMLQKLNYYYYTNNIFMLKITLQDIKKEIKVLRKNCFNVLKQK